MIRHLLESYGYLAVFLLVGMESIGIPLPGEAGLLTAAAYAATGHLSIAGVVVVAALGGVGGGTGGYWIGRTGGLALVHRYGRFWHVAEASLERAQDFFHRHGGKTVFLARFVSLLRIFAALLAGVSRMPFGKFTLYNAAGSLCWAALFGTLGYAFGRSLPQLERAVGQAGVLVALLGALFVVLVLLWRRLAGNWNAIVAWIGRQGQRLGATPPLRRLREQHPGVWAFVARRFAVTEYLGLHLTLGLVLSLSALWLFWGIAEDIVHHDPLTQFDLTIANRLHEHASAIGVRAARVISFAGSPRFITVWGLALGGLLLLEGRRLLLGGWIAALAGGGLLDTALKLAFRRPRPTWDMPLVVEHGWSFPSSHAMGSLIAYGMLAYVVVLALERRPPQIAVIAGAAMLVLLIGASRLYLGVHYFSDVVGGYAAGAVWLSACISGLEIARRRPLPAS